MSYPFAQPHNVTMAELINYIRTAASEVKDSRIGTNCKYKSISDFVLGAFSVFFFQDESFLKNQRRMKDEIGKSNAQTLFEMEAIPKRSAIAEMLDKINPEYLMPVFDQIFNRLEELRIIESYKYNLLSNQLLIALDGTQYFDSEDIHCKKCIIKTNNQYNCGLYLVKTVPDSVEEAKLLLGGARFGYFITELGELFFVTKQDKKSKKKSLQRVKWKTNINISQDQLSELRSEFLGRDNSLQIGLDKNYIEVTNKLSSEQLQVIEKITGHIYFNKKYVHQMITPILLHPESNHVLSLQPEFIENHDGYVKQDCEQNAAKRWLERHGEKYARYGVTILGDDLYSSQIFCENLLSLKMNFILVCKDGHKGLYRELELKKSEIQEKNITIIKNKKQLIVKYRYINNVNLTMEKKPLKVNWIEITEIEESTGKMAYHNTFVTNHDITENNYQSICTAGRAKWKVENENNNELKNHGYNLGHNYGHGSQYLSQNLAVLNIMAFLFHTIMALTSNIYDFIKNKFSSKKEIFEHFRVVTEYFCFNTWDDLLLKLAKKTKAEIDKIYKEKCLEPP